MLNGSVIYAYKLRDFDMNTSFVYNRYINNATDSGFILYKGVNYTLSQTLQIGKLQTQGAYSRNHQVELDYFTLDANGDYEIGKRLKIGCGIKYNQVKHGQVYLGGSLEFSLDFKDFGGLQFQYEKSYLPTIQQTLYPITLGRVNWYKFF
jgi:hypothetical protein